MFARETYLSSCQIGNILMYRRKPGELLGSVIVAGEGNKVPDRDGDGRWDEGYSRGDYTHCAIVTESPDLDAEVEEIRPGVYVPKDINKAGLRCHATWPVVKEEPIDWADTHMKLWRIRAINPIVAAKMVTWARKRIGRPYNWLHFLTFGLLSLPNAWICSKFVANCARECGQFEPYPGDFVLTPEGIFDPLITPNDLINSGKLIRLRYDGILKK